MAELISFEGFPEFVKAIESLERKVKTVVVKRALEAAAQPVAQMAEGIARTNSFDTGALADSILTTKVKAGRNGRYSLSIGPDFNSDVDYAFFVETGHKIGARKGNVKEKVVTDPDTLKKKRITAKDSRETYVPPEPFIRPAFDAHRDTFAATVAEHFTNALEELADKRSGKGAT